MRISPHIEIPEQALSERFLRAPGPGGQRVNKVETAVQLSLDLGACGTLPERFLARLRVLAGRRLSRDGVLTLAAHRHRSQDRNREAARERLRELLMAAAAPPPPPRRPTRPSAGARRARLDAKQRRGKLKRNRGRPDPSA